jgi:hypothetical protein
MGDSFGTAFERICRRCFFLQDLRRRSIPPIVAKTNTEKITKEIMKGLSEDSDDSDSYDVESGDEDSEDRPWRPSHTIFGKSTIKQSHIDAMRGRYFRDMSIVRVGGDSTAPAREGK